MRSCFIVLLVFGLSSNCFSQAIYSHVPPAPDTAKKYLFYLHGRIIEEQGVRAVSGKYGTYEYEEILKALATPGNIVISEPRPKDTESLTYAAKVVAQIDTLLKAGVPPNNITVIGASKGGGIAVIVSSLLKNSQVKFVIMAICNDETAGFWKAQGVCLSGRILYLFDTSDELAGSCKAYLPFLKSNELTEYKEIEIRLGQGHGVLYKPFKEWVMPTLEWAEKK